jgi:uncharacterized membrane protein YgcG
MKTWLTQTRLVAAVGAIFCLPFGLAAETNQASAQAAAAPAVSETAPAVTVSSATATASPAAATREAAAVKLPYGADDILKLSRAQISEDVTLNYIQNSGTTYGLNAKEIIYLKNEGVSDRVINAMQDQRKRVMESAAQTPSPAVQVYSGANVAAAAPVYAPEPIYVQEPLYFEPISTYEEETTPASSVYVIPYSSPVSPSYTFASSYPTYGAYGSYAVYGGPRPFGPALRHASGGTYRFGGGRSSGHVSGGSHGHSSGGHSSGGHHR